MHTLQIEVGVRTLRLYMYVYVRAHRALCAIHEVVLSSGRHLESVVLSLIIRGCAHRDPDLQ